MADGEAAQRTSPDDLLQQLGDEIADILRRLPAAAGSRRGQPGSWDQLHEEIEDVLRRLTGELVTRPTSATRE
jgi:hypothetical protein